MHAHTTNDEQDQHADAVLRWGAVYVCTLLLETVVNVCDTYTCMYVRGACRSAVVVPASVDDTAGREFRDEDA